MSLLHFFRLNAPRSYVININNELRSRIKLIDPTKLLQAKVNPSILHGLISGNKSY